MTRPFNIRFRPHPIATDEIERSDASADRLLEAPLDWLRRLHGARFTVRFEAPVSEARPGLGPLGAYGFRPLSRCIVRFPALGQQVEQRIDVWIDPTATVRAEVIGGENPQVFFGVLFDDGRALITAPPDVADWLDTADCEVIESSSVEHDLERLSLRLAQLVAEGTVPLLCANPASYRRHLAVMTRRLAKLPVGVRRSDGGLVYPMTVSLAAELLLRRDTLARTRLRLPSSPTPVEEPS